jgi:lysophospholipase L1-like esterase
MIGAPAAAATVVLVGDSHAEKYAQWLDRVAASHNVSIRLIAKGWCPPLLGLMTDDPTKNPKICANEFQNAFRQAIADPSIKTVVLAAEWAGYTSGGRHGSTTSKFRVVGLDQPVPLLANSGNVSAFNTSLAATIGALKRAGKRVIVVGPLPEYDFPVTDSVVRVGWYKSDITALRLPRIEYDARKHDAVSAFEKVRANIVLVDPAQVMCDQAWCYPYNRKLQPNYGDGNHLSAWGQAAVGPLIWQALVTPTPQ